MIKTPADSLGWIVWIRSADLLVWTQERSGIIRFLVLRLQPPKTKQISRTRKSWTLSPDHLSFVQVFFIPTANPHMRSPTVGSVASNMHAFKTVFPTVLPTWAQLGVHHAKSYPCLCKEECVLTNGVVAIMGLAMVQAWAHVWVLSVYLVDLLSRQRRPRSSLSSHTIPVRHTAIPVVREGRVSGLSIMISVGCLT